MIPTPEQMFAGCDIEDIERTIQDKQQQIIDLQQTIKKYQFFLESAKEELKRREDGGTYIGAW
jgi:peptidoglycan hydrolase CwlO-like protein